MANSLKTALTVNVFIAIMKFVLGFITASKAMLAEGAHSLADSFNQVLLYFGIRSSKRKEDSTHQFGYAKVQFFWAFVVAILIFGISGTFAFYEGMVIILNPEEHKLKSELLIYNIIALFVAALLEGYALRIAFKETKQFMLENNQPNLKTAIEEMQDPVLNTILVEDSLALLGLLIALVGMIITSMTGEPIWDGITSLVIGIVLISGGLLLARENRKFLIGKAVNKITTEKIRAMTDGFIEVESIKSLKTMLLGPGDMIIGLEIKFKDEYETTGIGELIDKVESKISKEIGVDKFKIFIEAQ